MASTATNDGPSGPNISEVDDDLFILYEWAAFYKVPVEYLYFQNVDGLTVLDLTEDNVKSLEMAMAYSMRETGNLQTTTENLDIPVQTALMIYTKLQLKSPVPREIDFWRSPRLNTGNIYSVLVEMDPPIEQNDAILLLGKLFYAGKLPKRWFKDLNDYSAERGFNPLTNQEFKVRYGTLNSLDVRLPKYYDEINQFLKNNNENIYAGPRAYIDDYKRWLDRWNSNVQKITGIVEQVQRQRDELLKDEPLFHSTYSSTKILLEGIGIWDFENWMLLDDTPMTGDEVLKTYGVTVDRLDNTPIQNDDGLELFNIIRPSIYMPYIAYNVGKLLVTPKESIRMVDRTLSKVYNSPDSPHQKFENIMPLLKKNDAPDTIYMIVWLGPGSKSETPKESYVLVKWDIFTNRITFQIEAKRDRDVDNVTEKLFQAVPIRVPNWRSDQMNVEFKMLDVQIDIFSLLYLLRIFPEFKYYMYIDEGNKPITGKPSYVHYRSPLSYLHEVDAKGVMDKVKEIRKTIDVEDTFSKVRFSYSQEISGTGDRMTVEVQDGLEEVIMNKGDPYVVFHVSNVTEYEVRKIIKLLSHAFAHYNTLKESIIKFNQQLVPSVYEDYQAARERSSRKPRSAESTNDILRKLAPDIFVENYASLTQRDFQPIPIQPDQVNEWKNRTFKRKGKSIKRQVMSFPPPFVDPGRERILLVCPNDDNPYPGVKVNNLDNKDKYPYMPYCYKTDKMSPHVQSNYNEWYRNQPRQVRRQRVRTVGAHRIVDDMRYGELPPNLKKLLHNFDPDAQEFKRLGMPQTPNSILHAILSLTHDNIIPSGTVLDQMSEEGLPNYTDEGVSVRQRSRIVSLVRQDMAININVNVLMQENWNETPEDIRDKLMDDNVFFDPALYYRAIEEYFNITIFTFANVAKLPAANKNGYELQFNQLEIPNHSKYYLRREREDRPVVMIFKFVSKTDHGQKIPAQCELIVRDTGDSSYAEGIFEPQENVIGHLYDLFYKLSNIYQWSIGPTVARPISTGVKVNTDEQLESLIVGRSLNNGDFSHLDNTLSIRSDMTVTTIGQILDDFGKCQALYYEATPKLPPRSKAGPSNVRRPHVSGFNFLIMVLPVQPYSLPTIDASQINLPSYDQIKYLIQSDVIGVTRKSGWGQSSDLPAAAVPSAQLIRTTIVTGLWYSAYRRTYAMFIPIQDTVETVELSQIGEGRKIGMNMLRWLSKIDDSDRMGRMNRLAKINVTILSVLEWLFRISQMMPEEFISRLRYPDPEFDPLTVYKLDDLSYHYPEIEDLDEALNYIQEESSGLIEGEYIMAYNRDYYDSLVFYIKDMYKLSEGLIVAPPARIPKNFQRPQDFYHEPGALIFMSKDEIDAWMRSEKTDLNNNLVMRDKLGNYLSEFTEPYIFNYRETNSIYLIQNVDSVDISIERFQKLVNDNPEYDPRVNLAEETMLQSRIRTRTTSKKAMKNEIQLQADLTKMAKALNVANIWQEKLMNIGYFSPEFDGPFPPHIVYSVIEGQTLAVKSDRSDGNENPLQIISYGNGYGAMLRIA